MNILVFRNCIIKKLTPIIQNIQFIYNACPIIFHKIIPLKKCHIRFFRFIIAFINGVEYLFLHHFQKIKNELH